MPRPLIALALSSLLCAGVSTGAAADAPRVVVSIKPLYGLVARVMEGVGTPELLVTGAASLHTYSLRPSQAALLERAQLVVWVGPGLETFLTEPLENLSAQATVVEAFEVPGVRLLPARVGGTWEAHVHAHGDEDHDEAAGHDDDHDHDQAHDDDHDHDHEGGMDGHLWLDPDNAQAIVAAVTATLSEMDPGNAARYAANGAALTADLKALDRELAAELAPIAGRPFVVFHDAYQYFEVHYGLDAVGSITVTPDQAPGAQRLGQIRDKILELKATCVFAEPQFQSALLDTVVEGTGARVGVLDPEGTAQEPSPQGYEMLMRALADSLKACLAPQG